MSLSLSIDDTTPDQTPSPAIGLYAAVSSVTLTIGPVSATWNYPTNRQMFAVYDDLVFPTFTTDRVNFYSTQLGPNLDTLSFQFDDLTYSAFAGDALPLSAPDPSAFLYTTGVLDGTGFFNPRISFKLTSVPEPTTLLASVAGIGVTLRRRRR